MRALRPCGATRADTAATISSRRTSCMKWQREQQPTPGGSSQLAVAASTTCPLSWGGTWGRSRRRASGISGTPAKRLAINAAASSSNGASWQGSQPQTQQQQQASQQQAAGHAMPPYAAWPATAKVALRTGAYITALGLAIFFLPASLFGAVFDASRVALGWVRVGGVLASLFGAYYLGAAMDDAAGRPPLYFYQTTIVGRLVLSAAFTYLVATRQCEPGLLLLAAANAASSMLLRNALQQRHAH